MWLKEIEICNIRCFHQRNKLQLSSKTNIIIGPNNSGKSTLINLVMALQDTSYLSTQDKRHNETQAFVAYQFGETNSSKFNKAFNQVNSRLIRNMGNSRPANMDKHTTITQQQPPFIATRPKHLIVPFLSNRQTSGFREEVNQDTQKKNDGTYSNLYSQVDRLATAGHPDHEKFKKYIMEIIGLQITTTASQNGKKAGFYFNRNNFVSLDQMGSGVAELTAIITALCTETKKIIIIEEPETNLHPTALKSLLSLIRESSLENQFIISTHSNIVVRELGAETETNIIEISKTGHKTTDPSEIRLVPKSPMEHQEILKKLGYEFSDFGLYHGWLFLEESSAETIIKDIIIPNFVPKLSQKIRTFSASGVTNIEPAISEFLRLVTFVHLEPIYKGKLWIYADGDEPGIEVITSIKEKFPYLSKYSGVFKEANFEKYYPSKFSEKTTNVLSIANKRERKAAKKELLLSVIRWTKEEPKDALAAWQESAKEPIEILKRIEKSLEGR